MSYAMQNPHRLLILGCVLKPEVIKRAFWSKKSGLFSFHWNWMNVHVVCAQNIYNYWNIVKKVVEAETWEILKYLYKCDACYFEIVCKKKTKLLGSYLLTLLFKG